MFFFTSVFEEFLFRIILFRFSEELLGSIPAILISGLLFGFIHHGNPNATMRSSIFIAIEAGLLVFLSAEAFGANAMTWAILAAIVTAGAMAGHVDVLAPFVAASPRLWRRTSRWTTNEPIKIRVNDRVVDGLLEDCSVMVICAGCCSANWVSLNGQGALSSSTVCCALASAAASPSLPLAHAPISRPASRLSVANVASAASIGSSGVSSTITIMFGL